MQHQSDSEAATFSSQPKQGVEVVYKQYRDERDLPVVMGLVDDELSEPYSIFTYRYFLHNWPRLCWLAYDGEHCFGVVVCKMDAHRTTGAMRGYIAMLVVEHAYRGLGVGSALVRRAVAEMVAGQCEEVVLEAEISNGGALALYAALGFIRDKRLRRYYLNDEDAYRLKLLLPLTPAMRAAQQLQGLSLANGTAGVTARSI